jgi:hypothetical protein
MVSVVFYCFKLFFAWLVSSYAGILLSSLCIFSFINALILMHFLGFSTNFKLIFTNHAFQDLPYDAYQLLAVPPPISGALVICANSIHYRSQVCLLNTTGIF